MRATAYTKPRARAQMRSTRSGGLDGATSRTVSIPAVSASVAQGPISSMGRSGRIAPLTPADASDRAMRLCPARNTRL